MAMKPKMKPISKPKGDGDKDDKRKGSKGSMPPKPGKMKGY